MRSQRSSSSARTASVRAVVLWSVTITLLVLGGLGLSYRYLAFHWWPEWVIATSPSIDHLIDCWIDSTVDSERNGELANRLFEKNEFNQEKVANCLVARLERANDTEAKKKMLWLAFQMGRMPPAASERRWKMVIQCVNDYSDINLNYSGLIMLDNLYVSSLEHDADILMSWEKMVDSGIPWDHELEGREGFFRALLETEFTDIFEGVMSRWHEWTSEEIVVAIQYGKICNDERLRYFFPIIENSPLPLASQLIAIMAARYEFETQVLNLARQRDGLAEGVWIGLRDRESRDFLDHIEALRDSWLPVLLDDLHEDGQAAVLIILGNSEDPRYLGLLVNFLSHSNQSLRRMAAVSLVQLNQPEAIEPIMDLVEDVECFDIAVSALHALDDGRVVELLRMRRDQAHDPGPWQDAIDECAEAFEPVCP